MDLSSVPSLLAVARVFPPCVEAIPHISQRINASLLPTTIAAAVYNDLQRVVQVYGAFRPWSVKAMDGAAARGRLDIVQRLHNTRTEGFSPRASLGAAAGGHLAVLQWLYDVYRHLCRPEQEILAAAEHGRDNIAVECGHVGVMEFLLRFTNDGGPGTALTAAVTSGRLDMAPMILERFDVADFWIGSALSQAVQDDQSEMATLLLEKCPPRFFKKVEIGARTWVQRLPGATDNIIDRCVMDAAKAGRVGMVELLVRKSGLCAGKALREGALSGQREVVKFLLNICEMSELIGVPLGLSIDRILKEVTIAGDLDLAGLIVTLFLCLRLSL
ncbi:Ankyrin repeat and SAM domain-containing protein 3 [Phytophthora pseudosyringae]|uniref:Ankyrin repeat and SAM domain-containing protein 3 n=1 Tax=Phytophthora pseudosyringae TaxID=221518 RepID=A0A8T1VRE5_9STRA|nr:Ankyrin repeat and SAM domain-containing protein 3 [Phytophthora pseudosyringae]